jgi:hypothetical protein
MGGGAVSVTTEEAEVLVRFHDISKELYSDNPEDRGLCAMHHSSAAALRDLAAERDLLRTENARLREALRLAIDAVEFWAAYATPYFQDKHDLEEDLRKLRAALGETQ